MKIPKFLTSSLLNKSVPLALGILVLSSLFTVTGFLGQYGNLLDLTSHFRIQYFLIQAISLPIFLLRKNFKWAVVVLPFFLINLSQILPFYLPEPHPNRNDVIAELKILHFNVHVYNREFNEVGQHLQKINPDIVILEEMNSEWLREITPFLNHYPYRKAEPREDSFGIGMFSRIPLEESEVKYFSSLALPSIVSRISIKGKPITILATHLMSPVHEEYFQERNQQFEDIARLYSGFKGSFVLIGDLNSTPWSYPFQNILKKMRLKDSQMGRGLQPSWPASFFTFPLIPIDHCLVSKDLIVLERKTGPYLGSDHYPLYVKLGLSR